MSILDLFKTPDINEGAARCAETPGALLLDVREAHEYAAGHIPGSVSLPLSAIHTAAERIPQRDTPLFVYCLSGRRSASAIDALRAMGYTELTNLGGIRSWCGALER